MILLVFSLLSAAFAAQPPITSYDCRVVILAKDLAGGGAEDTFSRPFVSRQAHGGQPHIFTSGDHSVSVLADSKWRAITWEHKGKVVASTVTAGTDAITGNAVMIVYHPTDSSEQVQLVCDPFPGKFPNE